jgi:transposase InsO family protein
MSDRSSRPRHSAGQTSQRRERRVIGLRVSRRWGPARIAYLLGMTVSTVHKILRRYGCPPLSWTDPATGVRIRGPHGTKREVRRYVWANPGDMVHVDIKKLGRIPEGGGHKVLGRAGGRRNRTAGTGYWFIHNAIDDCTRLDYSELLLDEKKETAVGFWQRAQAYFESVGITVQRVLTDNGSCYNSKLWAQSLADADIVHKRTRPYRPQTNGKVERFNRTMVEEWAYARPYSSETERAASFNDWLHTYNHHRGHTALSGKSPADLVPNLRGQNS